MKLTMRVPTGNLLRAARHAVGLDQRQLAKSADVDPTTISRMEGCGAKAVTATSRNLQSVLDALSRAGVEVLDDGLKLTKKRR